MLVGIDERMPEWEPVPSALRLQGSVAVNKHTAGIIAVVKQGRGAGWQFVPE